MDKKRKSIELRELAERTMHHITGAVMLYSRYAALGGRLLGVERAGIG